MSPLVSPLPLTRLLPAPCHRLMSLATNARSSELTKIEVRACLQHLSSTSAWTSQKTYYDYSGQARDSEQVLINSAASGMIQMSYEPWINNVMYSLGN